MSIDWTKDPDEVFADGQRATKPDVAVLFNDIAAAIDGTSGDASDAVAAAAAAQADADSAAATAATAIANAATALAATVALDSRLDAAEPAIIAAQADADALDLRVDVQELPFARVAPAGLFRDVRFNASGQITYIEFIDGHVVDAKDFENAAETPIGGLKVMKKDGVDTVFQRYSKNTLIPVSNGPYDTKLLTDAENKCFVICQGTPQARLWRVPRIGSLTEFAPHIWHLEIGIGQSLALGHTATGEVADPPWKGNVLLDRAFMFDGSQFDGLDRGPRPVQVTPENNNKDVVVADGQLTRMVPLHAAVHAFNDKHGQTPCESFAAALLGSHLNVEDRVVCAIIGTGATESADFIPGTPDTEHMQSIKKVIAAFVAHVAKINVGAASVSEPIVMFTVGSWSNQGEADNNKVDVDQAEFTANWEAIIAAIKATVTAAGGAYVGHIFHHSLHRKSESVAGVDGMACLAITAGAKAGKWISLPYYQMLPGINGHYFAETNYPLGSAMAYIRAKTMEGIAWFTGTGTGTNLAVSQLTGTLVAGMRLIGHNIPVNTYLVSDSGGGVWVTSNATTINGKRVMAVPAVTYKTPYVADGDAVRVSDTEIRCTFTGGDGSSFIFDVKDEDHPDGTIPNRPDGNYGVTMTDINGEVTVESVEWDGAELVITHEESELADNPIVKFGLDGDFDEYLPDVDGPRVNIRDTSNQPCTITGQIVSGWVMHHTVAVTA